jgi:hypothetical protein
MLVHNFTWWHMRLIRYVQPVSTMLQYRLYPNQNMPANLQGLLKASANIGSVIGQFLFGELCNSIMFYTASY